LKGKNLEALRWNRKDILAMIANLPIPSRPSNPGYVYVWLDGDQAAAIGALDKFVGRFGDLYPGITRPQFWREVLNFRYHWGWRNRTPASGGQRTVVSLEMEGHEGTEQIGQDEASVWCMNILNRPAGGDSGPPPVIKVDVPSGKIRITPETLLDWLVLQFVQCRRNLAICPRGECGSPYFVKTPARKRYCSLVCYHSERRDRQEAWERENRINGVRKRSARKTPRSGAGRNGRNVKTRKRKKPR
jgi:hypothetical protein